MDENKELEVKSEEQELSPEEAKQKRKKSRKKNILNVSLLFLFSFIVMYLFVKDDFQSVLTALSEAKWIIVAFAIGLESMTFMLDALVLLVLARKYRPDYTFKEAMINAQIGIFWSDITPSATGGQFVQGYCFKKQGIAVENSASLLIKTFLSYEVSILIICSIAVISRFDFFTNPNNNITLFGLDINMLVLVIIGFVINLIGVFGVVFIAEFKGINAIVRFFVRIGGKLHIIKNVDSILSKLDKRVAKFKEDLVDLRKHWKVFTVATIYNIIKWLIHFSIPYFCALALNITLPIEYFVTAIVLASFVHLIASYVPIPGASGGIEFFFGLFFASFFANDPAILASGMFIWRFVTFYFGLLVSMVVFLNFNKKSGGFMPPEVPTETSWYFIKKKRND